MVATFVQRERDIRGAKAYAAENRERIKICETRDEFIACADDPAVRTMLLDPLYWDNSSSRELGRLLRLRAATAPRVVVLHGRGYREGELLARLAMEWQAIESAYREYCADAERCLACRPNEWTPGATPSLTRVFLGAELDAKDIGVVVMAIAEAERMTTLARVARAAGVSENAVASLLRRFGFRSFADFRALCRIMHATFRLGRGATLDLTSNLAGFESGKALHGYFTRNFDVSPSVLREFGFESAIGRLCPAEMRSVDR